MKNMKNGLSYFDNGGLANADSGAQVPVTSAKSRTGVTPAGTTSLGPEQTESILANMQALIDKRNSPMSTFLGGLQEASAWGAGGEHGPSAALTAVRRQRQLEEADTLGMQEKMAAFRGAQAKAERDAQQVARFMGGTGAGGGTGGVPNLSPEAQARINLTTDPVEQKAIIQEDLKTRAGYRAKAEFDPAAMKAEEYVYIRDPETNEIKAKQVSLMDYQELKKRGLIVSEADMISGKGQKLPTATAPAVDTTRTAGNTLSQIQNSVYQTESSGGKADTSKPGVQGAIGPMQITQDTWNTNTARGVIPKNLDINNPRDNKIAGDKLLEYYYNKFGGNVDKTLAAYHGGEGAINPDGTINTNRKDANGMTIGNYIAKNKAQISSASAATTTAAKQIPDIAKIKAEKAVASAFQTEQAQISAKATQKEIEGFKSATEPGSVNNQIYLARRLGELTTKYKDNPRIVGLLNNPDMTSAVAGLLVDGLNTPVGSLSFKGLENAFQKTMPNATKEDINARQEIQQILKSYALEASKVGQGQGAMSDFERQMFEQIAGSTSNSMDMLRRVQQVMEARANFNAKVGRAFEDSYEAGKPQDFQLFKKSPEYRTAVEEHRNALLGITKDLEANPSGGPQNKAAGTPKWSHTEDEYTKWKKSKGIK